MISLDLIYLFRVLCLHLIKFEMLISFLIKLLFVQAVLFLKKFIILVYQIDFFGFVKC